MMLAEPLFLFLTCQQGAEWAVKREMAREWPAFRFAYSRPGFLTFKLPAGHRLAAGFDLRSVFARAYGFSTGAVAAEDAQEAASRVWQSAAEIGARRLHVWERDRRRPGDHGFEPGLGDEALALRAILMKSRPGALAAEVASLEADPIAQAGDLVLDCIVLEPTQWWLGYHRAGDLMSCHPGGFYLEAQSAAAKISRAYLKMEEAIRWSGFAMKPGDQVVELGSAPGGAAHALLERQLRVTGIDPAEMDPAVLAHPQFAHVRKRGHEVRRSELAGARWLTADMNVAPRYTLDTVEGMVTHPRVRPRGLLLTLKLLEWKLADEIPSHLERIRSWGYDSVRARQLPHFRQEICVAALKTHEPQRQIRRSHIH